MSVILDAYIKAIESDLRRGNATELTYRGALGNMQGRNYMPQSPLGHF
jgi:hypothetical protein